MTASNRNRRIPLEGFVLVRAGTAKEDGAPLRPLFEHESTADAQTDAVALGVRILVFARHQESLQSIDHV